MGDLQELIARVEGLEGPSPEADGLIAKYFGEIRSDAWWMTEDIYGEPRAEWVSGAYGAYSFHDPEEYTASLDAAVALCERALPGWKKSFFEDYNGLWIARVSSPRRELHSTDYMREREPGGSSNGAIALVLAILQALAAQEDAG